MGIVQRIVRRFRIWRRKSVVHKLWLTQPIDEIHMWEWQVEEIIFGDVIACRKQKEYYYKCGLGDHQ